MVVVIAPTFTLLYYKKHVAGKNVTDKPEKRIWADTGQACHL